MLAGRRRQKSSKRRSVEIGAVLASGTRGDGR
jgi:hypothetical protein